MANKFLVVMTMLVQLGQYMEDKDNSDDNDDDNDDDDNDDDDDDNRDFLNIQRRGRQRERQKKSRFY